MGFIARHSHGGAKAVVSAYVDAASAQYTECWRELLAVRPPVPHVAHGVSGV